MLQLLSVKISISYEKIITQLQGQRHEKLSGLLTDIDTLLQFTPTPDFIFIYDDLV